MMGEFSYIGLAALEADAIAAMVEATTQVAEDYVNKAQAATPVDTGTLRASIHIEGIHAGGTSVTAKVATGGEASQYAVPVHEGHRAGNSGYVAPVKYMEGPLLEEATTYTAFLQAAARAAF